MSITHPWHSSTVRTVHTHSILDISGCRKRLQRYSTLRCVHSLLRCNCKTCPLTPMDLLTSASSHLLPLTPAGMHTAILRPVGHLAVLGPRCCCCQCDSSEQSNRDPSCFSFSLAFPRPSSSSSSRSVARLPISMSVPPSLGLKRSGVPLSNLRLVPLCPVLVSVSLRSDHGHYCNHTSCGSRYQGPSLFQSNHLRGSRAVVN